MTTPPPRCEGTHDALRLAVGIMSSPTHTEQRIAVRSTWGRESQEVLVCFLVGAVVKRTPRSPWDKHRAAERAEPDGGPKGELMPNPHADALRQEHARTGDVLVLPGSAEIHAGGTSGLKTLTWWRYVTAKLPNAEWVGKGDDDTFINLPRLFHRLPRAADVPMHSLFGTIKWGCYSDQRLKWEPSYKTWPCGRTQFARSQAPGESANLSKTYEGPYELALGWFFAMPRGLAELLAGCKYAAWFHDRAVGATHEPFLRKEDDPLNGFWLCAARALPCMHVPLCTRPFWHAAWHAWACASLTPPLVVAQVQVPEGEGPAAGAAGGAADARGGGAQHGVHLAARPLPPPLQPLGGRPLPEDAERDALRAGRAAVGAHRRAAPLAPVLRAHGVAVGAARARARGVPRAAQPRRGGARGEGRRRRRPQERRRRRRRRRRQAARPQEEARGRGGRGRRVKATVWVPYFLGVYESVLMGRYM